MKLLLTLPTIAALFLIPIVASGAGDGPGKGARPAPAAGGSQSLGTIHPTASYIQTAIAVASFGLGDANAPVQYDTIPRTIRHDLELSGFFKQPIDLPTITRQNALDVKGKNIQWPQWQKLGAKHYLMGSAQMEGTDVLAVHAMLYDVDSQKLVFDRTVKGTPDSMRYLAHAISDEVVKYVVGGDGIARTKLIYIADDSGPKEVGLMEADGYNPHALTHYGKICTTPCWGANGAEVYYTSYHGNRGNIYGQLLSSGKTWTIAAYGGTNHSVEWSQTAKRVVMVLSKDGNSELYTGNRDGSGATRLTESKFTEGSPTWSPDGTKIAFASNDSGSVQLYTMAASGGQRQRLTNRGVWNDAVAWSPDGTKLAFVCREGGVNDIYTCDANGSNYRRMTERQGNNESPCWAPDGRHISFASDRSGTWQIYMMLDDGQNQKVLTSGGRNTQPDWGPQPKE